MSYANNIIKQLCMSLEKIINTSRRSTLKSETLLSLAVVYRRFLHFETLFRMNTKLTL